MHIYFWIILIGILLLLGIYLRRKWIPEQNADDSSASATDGATAGTVGQSAVVTQIKETILTPLQQMRKGFGRSASGNMVAQFRAWIPAAFSNEPQLQQWLAALNDEQIGVLVQHLQAFCHDMGFELTWLFEQQLALNPALQQALTEVVLYYHRASYQAVQLQGEVELFRIYHAYLQEPESRVHRALGDHLFGKLVEQGAASVSLSEHLALSKRQRQQQIVETIQQTATTNPKLFDATLRSVLIEQARTQMNEAGAAQNNSNPGNGAVNGNGQVQATNTVAA